MNIDSVTCVLTIIEERGEEDEWVHDVANLVLVPLSQYSLLLIHSPR